MWESVFERRKIDIIRMSVQSTKNKEGDLSFNSSCGKRHNYSGSVRIFSYTIFGEIRSLAMFLLEITLYVGGFFSHKNTP